MLPDNDNIINGTRNTSLANKFNDYFLSNLKTIFWWLNTFIPSKLQDFNHCGSKMYWTVTNWLVFVSLIPNPIRWWLILLTTNRLCCNWEYHYEYENDKFSYNWWNISNFSLLYQSVFMKLCRSQQKEHASYQYSNSVTRMTWAIIVHSRVYDRFINELPKRSTA